MTLELIDTKQSGNAWKVRLLLRALDIPFTRVTLDLNKEHAKDTVAGALNPLNRVPVLRLPDGTSIYESSVILLHLGKGTPFLPDDTASLNEVLAWLFFEQADLMHFVSNPRYFKIIGEAQHRVQEIEIYKSIAARGLTTLNTVLETRNWIASCGMSIADFAHFPYLNLAHEGGIDTEAYPAISEWMIRFQSHDWFEPLGVDP